MTKTKNRLESYPEIYKIPIIVTQEDLEYEKDYLEFYDDEYWEKYKEEKAKKYA